MELTENPQYLDSLCRLHRTFPHWGLLEGKTILISGASGMIGSFLIDTIMLRNEGLPPAAQTKIIGLGRNRETAERRFKRWAGTPTFIFIRHDVSIPLKKSGLKADMVIHAASTTHPVAYATEPVDTIMTNVLGGRNLLELAARVEGSRFLLLSSVEIYGENRGDVEYFDEEYFGYLNCNTLRAGYPEAKRTSEALCQAYMEQRGVDAVILRLPRCYGPTMRSSDSKAAAQFIRKAAAGEDILLKSEGNQLYSYAHVYDAVSGILWAICQGGCGEAYNLGDTRSDITLRKLAEIAAEYAGAKVIFDLPGSTEKKGFSTASKALLDSNKLKALGWRAEYDLKSGLCETIDILRKLDSSSLITH